MAVGVLALQGSSEPHRRALRRLGVSPRLVRRREDLEGLRRLVIPGGESTTMHHLLELFGMWRPMIDAGREGRLAFFGTCAGSILLGRASAERPPRMQLLDAVVERNAYGRQIDSFTEDLRLDGIGPARMRGVFIRAPRFGDLGPGVKVRARRGGEPVLVEGPGVLASTCHPELTDELAVHDHFLREVQPAASPDLLSAPSNPASTGAPSSARPAPSFGPRPSPSRP